MAALPLGPRWACSPALGLRSLLLETEEVNGTSYFRVLKSPPPLSPKLLGHNSQRVPEPVTKAAPEVLVAAIPAEAEGVPESLARL